jgi:hypothetical protein
MSRSITVTAALVWAAACARQSSPENAREHERTADANPKAVALHSEDTAFVELRRVEEVGTRSAGGGCRFVGNDSARPPGIPKGAAYEQRYVSIDRRTCASIVLQGYRLKQPPLETRATAESTLSATFDFTDSTKSNRRKQP